MGVTYENENENENEPYEFMFSDKIDPDSLQLVVDVDKIRLYNTYHSNDVQPSKAHAPIAVTLSGISIVVVDVQL